MRVGENIYKRKDGRWEARILVGKEPDGKARYKYFYAPTYRNVLDKKRLFDPKHRVLSEDGPEPVRFQSAADLWLSDNREKWKASTYIKYRDCLHEKILPEWAERELGNICQEDYDSLIRSLGRSLNGSSIRTVNTVLRGIFTLSRKKKLICGNPIVMADPQAGRKEADFEILSSAEAAQLTYYACTNLNPRTLGVLIALYEGVRLGELCALQWNDIDLAEKVIHIRKNLQRIKNPDHSPGKPKTILHFDLPKNGKKRTIPIHPVLLGILEEERPKHTGSDFVTCGEQPMEPRICTYHFKRILTAAYIGDTNFHTLRHTFASNCVEAGMNIKALSEILGHSSVKITMDRYVHLSMRYKQNQIGILKFPYFSDIRRQNSGQPVGENAENAGNTGACGRFILD